MGKCINHIVYDDGVSVGAAAYDVLDDDSNFYDSNYDVDSDDDSIDYEVHTTSIAAICEIGIAAEVKICETVSKREKMRKISCYQSNCEQTLKVHVAHILGQTNHYSLKFTSWCEDQPRSSCTREAK